tara:strand:- start:188 stop:733 length:546 start_codon:yes stop_codon:yes gene_type:complete
MLTRKDMVTLIVDQTRQTIEDQLENAREVAKDADDALHSSAVKRTNLQFADVLCRTFDALGLDVDKAMYTPKINFSEAYIDEAPSLITVVVSDDVEYLAKIIMRLSVSYVEQSGPVDDWIRAHTDLRDLYVADQAVKRADPKVKAQAINELLKTAPEGAAVLAALKAFRAAVAVKAVDEDD